VNGDALEVNADAIAAGEGELPKGGGDSAFSHVVQSARPPRIGGDAGFGRHAELLHEIAGGAEIFAGKAVGEQGLLHLLGEDGCVLQGEVWLDGFASAEVRLKRRLLLETLQQGSYVITGIFIFKPSLGVEFPPGTVYQHLRVDQNGSSGEH